MRWRMYLRDRGAMLTEISVVGGRSPTEWWRHHRRDGRWRVRKCRKGWMSSSTPLLDSSSIVVGERHRIRFGARRRLLSHEKKKKLVKKKFRFSSENWIQVFYLEARVGSVTALPEFHSRATGFRVWCFDTFAWTAFSGRYHLHAGHGTTTKR